MGTAAGTGMSSKLSRPPDSVPSHVYQPTYRNYTAPYNIAVDRAITGASGLADTPQAKMYNSYAPQMPTFSRPEMTPPPPPPSGGFGRFPMQALSPQPAYRIPMAPVQRPAADPNLAIINQALAPLQVMYDSDGNPYKQPRYMEQSQRDAILQNPGTYLSYARYIQAGNDPSTYRPSLQRPQMINAAQQEQFNKSQKAELGNILPPAAPTSNDS